MSQPILTALSIVEGNDSDSKPSTNIAETVTRDHRGNIKSIVVYVARGATVFGDIDGSIIHLCEETMVTGHITGNAIYIGDDGMVSGDIQGKSIHLSSDVMVKGGVTGDVVYVDTSGMIGGSIESCETHLRESAKVIGSVTSTVVYTEEGVIVVGETKGKRLPNVKDIRSGRKRRGVS